MKHGWWKSPRIGAVAGSLSLIVMASAKTSRAEGEVLPLRPPGATSRAVTSVRCVPAGPASGAAARAVTWHHAGDAIHFAIVWNPRFQTHDLLFMNGGRDAARVRFTVAPPDGDSRDAVTRDVALRGGARRLPPGERESLPGHSVTARPDGRVCLQIATGR